MVNLSSGVAPKKPFQHIGGFSSALDYLEHKIGTSLNNSIARVSREGWNGKGMWISIHYPEGGSQMTLPFIYMFTAQGDLVPWLASQTDILAKDWMIVND